MTGPRKAVERLRQASLASELAAVCRRHGVALLVAFGSAVRGGSQPGDLDLAIGSEAGDPDILGFLDEISGLAGISNIDIMDLDRAGPVARERALVGGVPLVEAHAGEFARAQLAAIMERMDTAWLRKMDLELMTR